MSGLYVRLPFCARLCACCDFPSRKFDSALAGPLCSSLCSQPRQLLFGQKTLERRVYPGGGAPSIWPGERARAGMLPGGGEKPALKPAGQP
jgi:coproporphyrinogen III oxidase-like Fe-S oxidoreductase